MAGRTQLAAELLGRAAVDLRGRRLGRIIAVIHTARGADVLIEARAWFFRRTTVRCSLHSVSLLPSGVALVTLIPEPRTGELPAVSGGTGALRVWIDGVRAISRTDLPMSFDANNGWVQVHHDPIWGGVGDAKRRDDYVWLDETYVSGP